MESKVFYRAANGTEYELTVRHDHDADRPIPKHIREETDGRVVDESDGGYWDSLMDMTHWLRCELVEWGSDVGD